MGCRGLMLQCFGLFLFEYVLHKCFRAADVVCVRMLVQASTGL